MKQAFNVDVAAKYGLRAAIMLELMSEWTAYDGENEEPSIGGYIWERVNVRELRPKYIPYMSVSSIHAALRDLVAAGLIVEGNPYGGQFDRAKWYAITEKGKSEILGEEQP